MASIDLRGVTVARQGRRLLSGVDLSVVDGERAVVLGPSGAGKTTLLRAVAGLEEITQGRILLDGVDATTMRPAGHDTAWVARSGGLLPHRAVRDNLAFPLQVRRMPNDEVADRVDAQSRAFALTAVMARRPDRLSAGEASQASLARSLIRRSAALLIDEPFLRIDPARRSALAREVVAVQEGYGITMLVATNDPSIALGLGQKLAVLEGGTLAQSGTPQQLLDQPATCSVASCLGAQPLNLLTGTLRHRGEVTELLAGALRLSTRRRDVARLATDEVQVGIRPTDLRLGRGSGRPELRGVVSETRFLGHAVSARIDAEGTSLTVHVPRPGPVPGERVEIEILPDRIHLFDRRGSELLHGW